MILGVNGIRLTGNISGVGRAIEAIVQCLSELDHPFREIRVYTPRTLSPSVQLPNSVRNVVLSSRWMPNSLWEQIVLPKTHGRRDLLFCPSYVIPILSRCPTLLVHHGSYEGYNKRHEDFSWWSRLKARGIYHLSAQRASIVTTVSESSRRDMARFYGIDPERIHVIPEGVDTRLFRPLENQADLSEWRRRVLGDDVPFILYVGKPTKRRNLPNLLKAFAKLKKEERRFEYKLVIIGTALPGSALFGQIQTLDLHSEVVQIGHMSHNDLVRAYNASELFIYPSEYEGFGMPVLEAMACGTPVIAQNNTAFPEFAGGVAELLPDAEVETLRNGMAALLADEDKKNQMKQAGPRRAAEYDWRIVTRRYLDLMLQLVNS